MNTAVLGLASCTTTPSPNVRHQALPDTDVSASVASPSRQAERHAWMPSHSSTATTKAGISAIHVTDCRSRRGRR